MKVSVSQVYIEPGISFPFTSFFQKWISGNLTELTYPSKEFNHCYGENFHLIFRMSAKAGLRDVEIRGPSVYRKDRDVEYTIFLPYDVIVAADERFNCALDYLLRGIIRILKSLKIDTSLLEKNVPSFIKRICSDPAMFRM